MSEAPHLFLLTAGAQAALGGMPLAAILRSDYGVRVVRGFAHAPTASIKGPPFIETFTLEEIAARIGAAMKASGIQ